MSKKFYSWNKKEECLQRLVAVKTRYITGEIAVSSRFAGNSINLKLKFRLMEILYGVKHLLYKCIAKSYTEITDEGLFFLHFIQFYKGRVRRLCEIVSFGKVK